MELGIEPDGVDLIIDSRSATKADFKAISEAIAYYKATGKVLRIPEIKARKRKLFRIKKNTSSTSRKSKFKA